MAKVVLGRKLTALNAYIRKEGNVEVNDLSVHLKNQENRKATQGRKIIENRNQ